MYLKDNNCDNSVDIANLFAAHFSSVYNNPNIPLSETTFLTNGEVSLQPLKITRNDIFEKIKNLNVNKGPGQDNIPPSIIHSCGFAFVEPLFVLFN